MFMRPMTVADVPSVISLLKSMEGTVFLDWETPEVMTGFIERCPRQAYVADEDGIVRACVFLSDGMRGLLHHLAVDASCRRRGIATLLMQAILKDYCHRTGVRRIQAIVRASNGASLSLGKSFDVQESSAPGGPHRNFLSRPSGPVVAVMSREYLSVTPATPSNAHRVLDDTEDNPEPQAGAVRHPKT